MEVWCACNRAGGQEGKKKGWEKEGKDRVGEKREEQQERERNINQGDEHRQKQCEKDRE